MHFKMFIPGLMSILGVVEGLKSSQLSLKIYFSLFFPLHFQIPKNNIHV